MKLVLQIAAGVVIAILAVLGVYTPFQKSEAHVYARRQAEQQRIETEGVKLRLLTPLNVWMTSPRKHWLPSVDLLLGIAWTRGQ